MLYPSEPQNFYLLVEFVFFDQHFPISPSSRRSPLRSGFCNMFYYWIKKSLTYFQVVVHVLHLDIILLSFPLLFSKNFFILFVHFLSLVYIVWFWFGVFYLFGCPPLFVLNSFFLLCVCVLLCLFLSVWFCFYHLLEYLFIFFSFFLIIVFFFLHVMWLVRSSFSTHESTLRFWGVTAKSRAKKHQKSPSPREY